MPKKKMNNDYPALFEAVRIAIVTKRYAALRALLDKGLNPNSPNEEDHGRTLLFNNHLTAGVAKVLLAAGGDVNYRDANGMVPLHSANAEVAALLLKHGADIEAIEPVAGATPLITHAFRGDATMVKFLLGNGADVRATYRERHGLAGVMEAAALFKTCDRNMGGHEQIYRLVEAHVGRGLIQGKFTLKSLRDLR